MNQIYILAWFLLAIVIITSYILIRVKSKKEICGSIASELETHEYTIGNFKVIWSSSKKQLYIFHQSNKKRPLWQTHPGTNFISTARGEEKVRESRGIFLIKERISKLCIDQTLEIIKQKNKHLFISGKLQDRRNITSKYTFSLKAIAENKIRFEIFIHDEMFNRVYFIYDSTPDEKFFGFGEQFTRFDIKGYRLPIFIMEQGIGRGLQPLTFIANIVAKAGGAWHTTYAGVPHYISTKLRSLSLDNYEYNIFDLRETDIVQIEVFSNRMSGYIYYGESPTELIKEHTDIVGRMRPLPEWISSGAIIGLQGGTNKVLDVYSLLKKYNVPIAAFWLQDWVGQRKTSFGKQLWWNWELDNERYPNWDNLVKDLEKDGIKVLAYTSPFLIDAREKPNFKRNLFHEAAKKKHLINNSQGEPYLIQNSDFSAGLIDLTNQKAWNWYKSVLKDQLLDIGISGWMADFGEALPYDANMSSGESGAVVHNQYPELWAQFNRELIEEASNGNELIAFHRSGYINSPKYATLFWLGDQMVTWDHYDGLKTAVTALLSSGISGYSLNHSDIGGYTGFTTPFLNYHRDQELLLRWIELNAFTTVLRTHEGNLPDKFMQIYSNEETLKHFSKFAKIYSAWGFYRKQLMEEASTNGLPVVRHLFIHYPDDTHVYKISHQEFMIGTELLVTPVLKPKSDEVDVYLPQGQWVHIWSDQIYGNVERGKNITISAPLGEPAVFYKYESPIGEKFASILERMGI
jgi:alpha-glucosidase